MMSRYHRRLLALLLAALTLIALLAVPQRAEAATHGSTWRAKVRAAVAERINQQRAAHGLPALSRSPRLHESARRHSARMADANEMSHQLPGEPDLGTRIRATGYQWSWAGENIAWTSDITVRGVLHLQALMYHEKPPDDGHRLNILSTHYRQVGIGLAFSSGKVWLTTDFGRRA